LPLGHQGAWAELLVAPAALVARKPAPVPWETAAAFPVPALTADQAIARAAAAGARWKAAATARRPPATGNDAASNRVSEHLHAEAGELIGVCFHGLTSSFPTRSRVEARSASSTNGRC
jgi:hypothetical protein